MTIHVTAEDIAKVQEGMEDSLYDCAVARAMSRRLGRRVKVGIRYYWDVGERYAFPLQVSKLIRDICEGKQVAPFDFDLHPPLSLKKLSKIPRLLRSRATLKGARR